MVRAINDKKQSFIIYTDFPESAKALSDSAFREVICAACDYTEHGTLPGMSPEAAIAFSFLKVTLDRDREKWDEVKAARSEAGKKGADARWNGKT